MRFKIDHNPRPKEKNNTLGYPIMKKEKKKKEEKDERKAQRIRTQRPMKGKGFKNTQRKKGKAQSAKVSKPKKRSQGKLGWDPRKCKSLGISRTHNTT